jgi:hypothetical protein
MLTIIECVNGVKNAQIETLKGRILNAFYSEILSSASINKTEGVIYFNDADINLLVKVYNDLLKYNYDLQKYTKLDARFIEDGELVIEYNLKGFKDE